MSKFHLRMTIYVLLFIGIVGFVWLTCFNDWVDIYHNITTKHSLEEKYDQLVDTQDELNDEVNKLQDPEYVAKYAREKYLYTKDGEIIIDVSNNWYIFLFDYKIIKWYIIYTTYLWGRFLVSTDYGLIMVAGGKVSPKLPTQLNITDNTNYNTALAFA